MSSPRQHEKLYIDYPRALVETHHDVGRVVYDICLPGRHRFFFVFSEYAVIPVRTSFVQYLFFTRIPYHEYAAARASTVRPPRLGRSKQIISCCCEHTKDRCYKLSQRFFTTRYCCRSKSPGVAAQPVPCGVSFLQRFFSG